MPEHTPDWYRADGSLKGSGFLGVLQRPDGKVSSELSMGTEDITGKETDIPLLVPTLSRQEVQYLLTASDEDWKNPQMQAIAKKAVEFARERHAQGKPFFAEEGERNTLLYPDLPRSSESSPHMTKAELAATIKNQYPDYRDWSDDYLVDEAVKKFPALKGYEKMPIPKEPDTWLGGAIKGLREGAIAGAEGFVEGIKNSPGNAIKGIGKMLTTDPSETISGMVEGIKGIPDAIMSAGSKPKEFGEQVGDATGQTMFSIAGPKAIHLGARGASSAVGKAVDLAQAHPAAAGALAGGLIYPGGVRGALEGALGGGVLGRALRLGGKAAEGAAEVGEEGLSEAELAYLKKNNYTAQQIEQIRQAAKAKYKSAGPSPNFDIRSSGQESNFTPPAPDSEGWRGPTSIQQPPGISAYLRSQMRQFRPLLPPWKAPIEAPPSSLPDPSFVRGVPAQPAMSERLALPQKASSGIITEPPSDPSGISVNRAAKTEFPVRDPKTGKMRRVFTSGTEGEAAPVTRSALAQSSTPAAAAKPTGAGSTLKAEVQKLTSDGFGAEEIADKLKNHPDLKAAGSRIERINMVREARGGKAGELPGRARQAIDQAIEKLTTEKDKRAYLMRAPQGPVYNYIREKLGL